MKVRLSIDLELPPGTEDYSVLELNQMLFDDYVNYVTVSHAKDALKAMVQSSQYEREDNAHLASLWKHISERHQLLTKVTTQPYFTVEVL